MTRSRVAVLHGVNFDALDKRPAEHYGGGLTFMQLEQRIERFGHDLGLEVTFFQSNHEGQCVGEYTDALVLNPGAWTHYSWAIRDAVEIAGLPAVEVHLSDVEHREAFRQVSVLDGVRLARVAGRGVDGYRDALEILKEAIK
jgi:3-dehydroquinate dehydratase-2